MFKNHLFLQIHTGFKMILHFTNLKKKKGFQHLCVAKSNTQFQTEEQLPEKTINLSRLSEKKFSFQS